MEHYVIVGAGQAGQALAGKLRAEGFDGAITLMGAEDAPPYQRPPLSKAYLLGEMARERLYLRPEAWYGENGIALRLGRQAVRLDAAGRKLTLANGEVIGFDKLALTTGARPRRLPEAMGGGLEGVYTMRSLADADAIAHEFAPGRHLLVVGGGYIGLEAAAVARKMGLEVTLLEAAQRVLQRVAAPPTADYFRDLHRRHGVTIREQTALARLDGEGRFASAVLADGTEIAADFAVLGIGIEPDIALAAEAGLRLDNGIACDEFGETSVPGIYAAGDCAAFPHGGDMLRLESVGNAIDMAEAVARNMLGAGEPYRPKPWFWSDQYNVKLQIAGLHLGHDHTITRPGAEGAVSVWYYAGDRLIAVDAMNDPRAYMVGKRLIEAGRSPDPALVADPATELKSLMAA